VKMTLTQARRGSLKPWIRFVVLISLVPSAASAYERPLFEEVGKRVLTAEAGLLTPPTLQGASAGELKLFRRWLYDQIIALGDAQLVAGFRARYPSADAFDGRALRSFLGFTSRPRARLWSLDRSRSGQALDGRGLFAASASAPDRDGRTRDRYLYEPTTGQLRRDQRGRPIPEDPGSRLDGASAQLAADMVQLHIDLAILARIWGGRSARYLALTFTGQAFYYLLTAADPGESSTDGLFSTMAERAYLWRAFVTSGGYLTELRSVETMELAIVANYRRLQAELLRKRFSEVMAGEPTHPAVAAILETVEQDEPDVASAVAKSLEVRADPTLVGRAAVRPLTTEAAGRAHSLYSALLRGACGRVAGYGFTVPRPRKKNPVDYDGLICDPAELDRVYAEQAAGVRAAATAMRQLDVALAPILDNAASHKNGVLTRLVRDRLAANAAVEERRQAWMSQGTRRDAPVKAPAWPITQALLFFGVIALTVWRLNRRLPMPRYAPAPDSPDSPDSPEEPGA